MKKKTAKKTPSAGESSDRALSVGAGSPKALTKQEKRKADRKKKRYTFQKLTQNEVENLFTLPTDDEEFAEETKVVTNRSYLTLSGRLRIAAWATVLALAAFLIGMFYSYREEITVENFRFLMRNVNFRLESSIPSEENGGGLLYDRDTDRVFALYRDYVATVGNGRLTISDQYGNESYYEKLSYASPVLCPSKENLLCFDRGGTSYSLYNYFNNVGEGKCDYPITDAAISDSGIYALATREAHYYGTVLVYNKDSKLIQKIRKDKYIVSVDLSPDGKTVLVTSFYSSDQGQPVTEVASHPTSSTEADYILTLDGVLPYQARCLSDGSCALVCSDGVKFISSDGKVYNASTFAGQNVIKYEIGSDFVSYVSSSQSDASALSLTVLFPDKAKMTADTAGEPVLLSTSENCTYLYDGEFLCVLNHTDGTWTKQAVEPPQAILCDGEKVYLCLYTRMICMTSENRDSE